MFTNGHLSSLPYFKFCNFVERYVNPMQALILFLLTFLSLTGPTHYQATTPSKSNEPHNQETSILVQSRGIVVHQSPEIQMLSTRFKLENTGRQNIKGYRVQVFVGERARANEIKSRVNELYPEMPAEINYLAPNFRVRVGNFRTNLDADRFLRQIKSDFNNAYIVPDEIGLPSL